MLTYPSEPPGMAVQIIVRKMQISFIKFVANNLLSLFKKFNLTISLKLSDYNKFCIV
jgi:hypothetical protein